MRRAARLGAVAAVLAGVVLALLGLPHLFRAAPLRLLVSPGDSAGLPSIGDGRFTVMVIALAGVGLEPSPTGQVLTDGGGTFPVLYEDLRSARRSITMQVYYKTGGWWPTPCEASLGTVLDSLFTADIAFAREIELSEFRRRPWTERVRERAAALLERLL